MQRTAVGEEYQEKLEAFVEELKGMPIAIETDTANEQHYEVRSTACSPMPYQGYGPRFSACSHMLNQGYGSGPLLFNSMTKHPTVKAEADAANECQYDMLPGARYLSHALTHAISRI